MSQEPFSFFDRETLTKGEQLVREGRISDIRDQLLADGSAAVSARAADAFNFINHPRIVLEPLSGQVLSAACDCAPGRRAGGRCEHTAALALAASGEIPMPDAAPAPVPQPEKRPVESAPAPKPAPAAEKPAPAAEKSAPEDTPAPAEPEQREPGTMEILLGHDAGTGEPLIWRPNDTEQVFHLNTGVIGTMGTGKTQFTKSLVLQLFRSQRDNYDGSPLGILIFDYKGDYNETKEDFVSSVQARVLKPYRLPFNPFAITRTRAFRPLLPIHTANEFVTTISRSFPLGPKQQQVLLDCIVKAYAEQGIDPERPETWDRAAPVFRQVYDIYQRDGYGRRADSLSAALNKIQQFCLFEDRPGRAGSLLRLLRGVTVIDLSAHDEDIQSLIVAITLDQFYAQMQALQSSRTNGRYRQLRYLLLVDEADSFMARGFSSLKKILKEGREFGVGMILSTQSLSHFVADAEDYSRYVLTWAVHNVSDLKQRDVEYVFKLPPKSPEIAANYGRIKQLAKHECIVKFANEAPQTILDKPFWQLVQEQPERGGEDGSENLHIR